MLARIAVFVEQYVALPIDHILPNDSPCEIDVVVRLRERRQFVHIVAKNAVFFLLIFRRIHIEFAHQHAIGRLGVLVGAVSLEIVLHLASAVEFIGCGKVATLHFSENGLRVDESAGGEIEIDACTQKFLGQERHVEVVRVVAGEVAVAELLAQFGCQFLESFGLGHLFVGDARQFRHVLRNRDFGVHEDVFTLFASVGMNLDEGNLDDSVPDKVEPRCLQIEDNEGLRQI